MKMTDDLCKESKEKVTSEQSSGNWKELLTVSYMTPTSYKKNKNSFTSWARTIIPKRRKDYQLIFYFFLSTNRLSPIILNQLERINWNQILITKWKLSLTLHK